MVEQDKCRYGHLTRPGAETSRGDDFRVSPRFGVQTVPSYAMRCCDGGYSRVTKQALVAAMQAFAAIALHDAVYVACPVSSGRRELDLMVRLSLFDRDQLRDVHSALWYRDVLEPNKAEAAASVAAARKRYPGRSVINPSEFELDGLTQLGYDALCSEIIRQHVSHFVLADGWQFSRGARLEATLALELRLDVEDNSGRPLSPEQIANLMTEATTDLIASGCPDLIVEALLPQPMSVG